MSARTKARKRALDILYGADVRQDRQDVGAALVALEEDLEGALAGRVAGSHG